MKLEDLVDQLTRFGLDEREATTYYHLSRLGPSKAKEVVQATELGRTEAYRVLDALVSKGAVEKTLERPQRFVARPVGDVLELALSERRLALEELSQAKPDLVDAWPRPNVAEAEDQVKFSVLEGRAQIRGLLERLVKDAREEIFVIALKRGMARLESLGLLDLLQKQADEGVVVRVLTEVGEANLSTAKAWAQACEVRHVSIPGYHQAVMADNREIALFVTVDPLVSVSEGSPETVLSLNARDFILGQKAIADRLWDGGLDLADRIRELESGELAQRAEVVRGRWTRYDRMKDMLYRAQADALLVLTAEEVARLDRAGLAHLLEQRVQAGVRVRVLVPQGVELALDGVEVRQGASTGLPEGLLVCDDREVLTVLEGARSEGPVTDPGDWAAWVSVDREVERVRDAVERAWKQLGG